MSDLEGGDIAKLAVGGTSVVALLFGAVKWLGGRQLSQFDSHIKALTESIAILTRTVQELRETNIRIAEKQGSLEAQLASNQERINEAAKFWREQLKELAATVAEIDRRPARGRR